MAAQNDAMITDMSGSCSVTLEGFCHCTGDCVQNVAMC